jgi:DNA repair exonuclease SbcCD ATPase subunit
MTMAKGIGANGFKGLSFATELAPRTLIVGPNGTGKSARTQALQLALRGYIPGGPKKNEEILTVYGNGEEMSVVITIGALEFGRRFSRNAKGAVSQIYEVCGKKSAKEFFMQSLGEVGAPRVIDLAAFMDLSHQKKIDEIFKLFPPGGSIDKIDVELTKKKELRNNMKQKLEDLKGTRGRLTEARKNLSLPAGNLSEIQGEIAKLEGELKVKRKELGDLKIKEASERAVEEARTKAETLQPSVTTQVEAPLTRTTPLINSPITPKSQVRESFNRIMNVMERAGCSACAATMIIKTEMRRYQ